MDFTRMGLELARESRKALQLVSRKNFGNQMSVSERQTFNCLHERLPLWLSSVCTVLAKIVFFLTSFRTLHASRVSRQAFASYWPLATDC